MDTKILLPIIFVVLGGWFCLVIAILVAQWVKWGDLREVLKQRRANKGRNRRGQRIGQGMGGARARRLREWLS